MHGRGSPSDLGPGGSGGGNESGEFNDFNVGNGGPNEPDGDESPNYGGTQRVRNTDDDRLDREFRLVNPRNVTINMFNAKNLPSNPYTALNNFIRRLILAQGNDGITLIRVLDYVEKLGIKMFTMIHLNDLQRQCCKAKEFDRAIKRALFIWIAGIAHGLVKYGTEGGLDAWRKRCNKYMPFAHDMQNIAIREPMGLKLVGEADIDQLFLDVERICALYLKAGFGEDPKFNKWVKACVLHNRPDRVATTLALQLGHAGSVEEMQNLVTTMLHDHKTGMLRGQPGPMLHLIENNEREREPTTDRRHQTTV